MGKGINNQKRDQKILLRLSKSEVQLIDTLVTRLNITSSWRKISRADAIVKAVKFSQGNQID